MENKVPFPARLGVGAAWSALIGFGLLVVSRPELSVPYFALTAPILLAILAAHENMGSKRGGVWCAAACAFLLLVAGILRGRLSGPEAAQVLLQISIAAMACRIGVGLFREVAGSVAGCQSRIAELQNSLKSKAGENEFYSARIRNLKGQIRQNERLATYAREMGTLLDPEAIKQALIARTRELFPELSVDLKTSYSDDPFDSWAIEKRNSLLVQDAGRDSRFARDALPAFARQKSLMIAPLVIQRNLIGLLRVESAGGQKLSGGDLQQLEIYAHLAVLALENAQLFAKVNAMATQDGLTGLATHRVFQEKLEEELLRSARYKAPVSLLMLDIDRFKQVNDTYGHPAGDQVLKQVAGAIAADCRGVDFAARYGGEEFCVILPGLKAEEAAARAEGLRAKIEAQSVASGAGPIRFTISAGCAASPEDAATAAQLLRRADERLYRAKTEGRNRVVTR